MTGKLEEKSAQSTKHSLLSTTPHLGHRRGATPHATPRPCPLPTHNTTVPEASNSYGIQCHGLGQKEDKTYTSRDTHILRQ